MSETKHSTLPWTVEGPDEFGDYNILQPGIRLAVGAIVSNLRPPEEVAANAALLVLATSLHHELVAALEALYATIVDDQEHCDDSIAEEDCSICKAFKHAAAVLAKAKQPNLEEPK